jgi:hypothetical protein
MPRAIVAKFWAADSGAIEDVAPLSYAFQGCRRPVFNGYFLAILGGRNEDQVE